MFHFHAGRHVNERTAAKHSRIQRAKFVICDWNDFTEPLPENFRMILQALSRPDKDDALFTDCFS